MLNQALFLEIMYRYDITRHVQNQNTDLSMRKKKVFENLSPYFNTHDFDCVKEVNNLIK